MDRSTHIPAGLLDNNIEFFSKDGEIYCINNGKMDTFLNCDVRILDFVRMALEDDARAIKALDDLKITDPKDQLRKYILCRFGDFDLQADITDDGVITSEYVICTLRGICKHEGKLCKSIKAKNGYITNREIDIIQLIGEDLADKEIADRLGISENTVNVHRTNILRKTGCHSKVGIAVFASQHNLI